MARIRVDQARFGAAFELGNCWVWLSGDELQAGPLAEMEAQRELCRLEHVRFIDLGVLAPDPGRGAKPGAVLKDMLRLASERVAALSAAVELNIIEVDF